MEADVMRRSKRYEEHAMQPDEAQEEMFELLLALAKLFPELKDLTDRIDNDYPEVITHG